jgi:hypothetical protein
MLAIEGGLVWMLNKLEADLVPENPRSEVRELKEKDASGNQGPGRRLESGLEGSST